MGAQFVGILLLNIASVRILWELAFLEIDDADGLFSLSISRKLLWYVGGIAGAVIGAYLSHCRASSVKLIYVS